MKRLTRWLVIPLLAALLLSGARPALALDKQARLSVMSAVVQMSLVKVKGGQVYFLPWGSGTIISSDGLILTNCHVADPVRFGLPAEQVPEFDYLGVGLTVKSDRPPQLTYLAEVMQADPTLDLAVIRITKKTDLKPVAPEDINLPFVELGDSDLVEVGDDLNIFGYPGIGGETVTFTRGVVSGFTLDASISGRAWLKTDASIAGGNSGGTAVDEGGMLVGVPTRAGAGGNSEFVDCRPVKDTNGDGRIDEADDCVPVGGFINALRPVNLSKPLIEAARRGLPDPGADKEVKPVEPPTGKARLGNLFLASGVNEFYQPTAVVTSLPSNAHSLYLFFDYENMDQGRSFGMNVLIDGQERSEWSLPAAAWSGDAQGMWWVGWSDVEFEEATYELVPYIDGQEAGRAKIQIGGQPQPAPAFSNLVLSLDVTGQGEPKEPSVLFPAGTTKLSGVFEYGNMKSGLDWTQTWSMNGQVVATQDAAWSEGKSGKTSVSLSSPSGLQPGAYRLSLLIEGQLAVLSNFWVTGAQGSTTSFGPVTFAEGVDQRGRPVGAAKAFASGLEELHAFSTYSGMEQGIDFAVNWYIDDQKVIEEPSPWDGGESGDWHYYIYSNSGALPDGKYTVELLIEGQTLQQASATVGTGTEPSRTEVPSPDGVQVQGEITDLDTGRPIAGAMFFVLNPGITLETFQWTEAEVFTAAESDRDGLFKLPSLLQRGECYSILIGAADYWTYGEDDVCIDQSTPDTLELQVQLEKQ